MARCIGYRNAAIRSPSGVKRKSAPARNDAIETHSGHAARASTPTIQQSKSWELRAAMSMARLQSAQGKPQQVRELLAPVYGWFTEGFDTLDLKGTKALLEGLAA